MLTLSQRIRMAPHFVFILAGLILAAVIRAYVLGDTSKLDADIKKITDDLSAAKASLEKTNQVIQNKQKFEQEYNLVSEQFKAAVEYLPETINTQELLRQISNEGRAAGVNLKSVKPKMPETKEFYEEVSMEVELEGTFGLLTTYLAYISKLNRIVNIKNIDIGFKGMVDNAPKLSMKGVLVSYRYRQALASAPHDDKNAKGGGKTPVKTPPRPPVKPGAGK